MTDFLVAHFSNQSELQRMKEKLYPEIFNLDMLFGNPLQG